MTRNTTLHQVTNAWQVINNGERPWLRVLSET